MPREEDLAGLRSTDDSVRLTAARCLYETATADDRTAIASALDQEDDRWIREALSDALARIQLDAALVGAATKETSLDGGLRASGFDDAIRVVLHELRGVVGDLREAISLSGAADERVSREVLRLRRLIAGLDNLTNAGGPPDAEEFDLSSLVNEVVDSEAGERRDEIALSGPKVLITVGDPARLSLAVRNGLSNALDATDGISGTKRRHRGSALILVTWGVSGDHLWVGIHDRGPGLPPHFTDAFEFGRTLKSRALHSGLGLTIARRAARSLGGDVTLGPRDGGGADFVVEWPGQGEVP